MKACFLSFPFSLFQKAFITDEADVYQIQLDHRDMRSGEKRMGKGRAGKKSRHF